MKRLYYINTLILFFFGLILTACDTPFTSEDFRHTITLHVNDTIMGSVTGGGRYFERTTVTLKAEPQPYHEFIRWSDDEMESTRKITVKSDMELTAIFQEIPKYTITALSSDETLGTVTGGGTYYRDTEITLTATAKKNCYFDKWSDGETNATRKITVQSDMELTAIFQEIPKYTITVLSSDETLGIVTGGGTYYRDTEITLIATAKENCYFDKWSDGETNTTRKITVQSDMELTAIFQEIPKYTITALSSDENLGTVTGGGTYYRDTKVTLTAISKIGYIFAEWNDGNIDNPRTIIVKEDLTLTAYFKSWVDLGLPSGTLWAACNVGATRPEEYGNYFAWGETMPKSEYNEENYKWGIYNNSASPDCGMTKYNKTDGKTVLDPSDDAARANWGSQQWRMPTFEEMEELLNNCTRTQTTLNGVVGFRISGPNGNSIFMPKGEYWSSSLWKHSEYTSSAAALFVFDPGYVGSLNGGRYLGCLIRPVCSPQ